MKRFKKILLISTIALSVLIGYVVIFQHHPPILMYHSIAPNDSGSLLVVAPQIFEDQMEYLSRHQYKVVSLDDFLDAKNSRNMLALTFDDGYEDNYLYAYPILKKYQFPATIFLVTDWIGKKGYLTWNQIEEMEQHGISFGNHTETHAYLPSMTDPDCRKEIISAQTMLQKKIRHPSSVFCYPFGAYTPALQTFLKDFGFRAALATSIDGESALDDLYAFRRIRISNSAQLPFNFGFKVSGFYAPLRQTQRQIKKLKKNVKYLF